MVLLSTPAQLRSAANVTTVDVAGSTLPVASKLKSLGLTIVPTCVWTVTRETLQRPATSTLALCATRALRHVRRLLTDDVAQTVTCSIVASRLDYCNALWSGAPAATFD